jgi:predicted transcriptional regulator
MRVILGGKKRGYSIVRVFAACPFLSRKDLLEESMPSLDQRALTFGHDFKKTKKNLLVILLGKNRDRVSIVAAILEAAHAGSSKTRIMFNANLSFCLLEKYLDVALGAGFIQLEGSRYLLTERGREFLKQYRFFEERYVRTQRLLETLVCERERLTRFCDGSKLLQPVR